MKAGVLSPCIDPGPTAPPALMDVISGAVVLQGTHVQRSAAVRRRRGSAVECRTLERESPGSNPLHTMAPLMATRCGDNKQHPCNCTWQ